MEQNKSIYFYIQYSKKQKENKSNISFVVPEKIDLQPECIFEEEIPKDNFYFYKDLLVIYSSNFPYISFHHNYFVLVDYY